MVLRPGANPCERFCRWPRDWSYEVPPSPPPPPAPPRRCRAAGCRRTERGQAGAPRGQLPRLCGGAGSRGARRALLPRHGTGRDRLARSLPPPPPNPVAPIAAGAAPRFAGGGARGGGGAGRRRGRRGGRGGGGGLRAGAAGRFLPALAERRPAGRPRRRARRKEAEEGAELPRPGPARPYRALPPCARRCEPAAAGSVLPGGTLPSQPRGSSVPASPPLPPAPLRTGNRGEGGAERIGAKQLSPGRDAAGRPSLPGPRALRVPRAALPLTAEPAPGHLHRDADSPFFLFILPFLRYRYPPSRDCGQVLSGRIGFLPICFDCLSESIFIFNKRKSRATKPVRITFPFLWSPVYFCSLKSLLPPPPVLLTLGMKKDLRMKAPWNTTSFGESSAVRLLSLEFHPLPLLNPLFCPLLSGVKNQTTTTKTRGKKNTFGSREALCDWPNELQESSFWKEENPFVFSRSVGKRLIAHGARDSAFILAA